MPKPAFGEQLVAAFGSTRAFAVNLVTALFSLGLVLYLFLGGLYLAAPYLSGPRCELTVNSRIIQHHEGPVTFIVQWVLWPLAATRDIQAAQSRGVPLSEVRAERACPKYNVAAAGAFRDVTKNSGTLEAYQ